MSSRNMQARILQIHRITTRRIGRAASVKQTKAYGARFEIDSARRAAYREKVIWGMV